VDALLQDGLGNTASNNLAKVLKSEDVSADCTPRPIDPIQAATALEKSPKLAEDHYNALLVYLQGTGRQYRAFHAFPHPQNALILPPHAKIPSQMHYHGHTFSCQRSHEGNSAIQFYNPYTQQHSTGFIQVIWQVLLETMMHTFIVVRVHRPLSPLEEGQAPFLHYQGFMTRIVDALPSDELLIIEPIHIVTHLTTFRRPEGTYGIPKETLIVCWALNRGRK
jgi:hypothetical protein